jgi:hypothetical protein
VKAKDTKGDETDWSEPLAVTMPYRFNPFLQFLNSLIQRFPNVFFIVRLILNTF